MNPEFLVKLNREFESNPLRQPVSPFLSRWHSARKLDFVAHNTQAGSGSGVSQANLNHRFALTALR